MIKLYKDLLNEYKTDSIIKKLINEKKLYKISNGIYSTEEKYDILEYAIKKYNNVVITLDTALEIYDFKINKDEKIYLATSRKRKVIKDNFIKQIFLTDYLLDIGKTKIKYKNYYIEIYDKERLLIEIIRNKDKINIKKYNEILEQYKKRLNEISITKLYEYTNKFKINKNIINEIEKVVNNYKEVNMKGIVLAGGSGTRLYPITEGVSKQLLPIYDKPMIYYPISVLMLAGIKDILIITTEKDQPAFKSLLKDGSQFGVHFEYIIQPSPDGLAQAFILGEEFIGNDTSALILGDNLYYGNGFVKMLKNAVLNAEKGYATNFGIEVPDPERFGIMEIEQKDNDINIISVEEKPKNPKSNYAITGLYFYPEGVCKKAKEVKPSARGELEITSLNDMYLKDKKLKAELLGGGFNWFDTGTFESLYDAISSIKSSEQNRGKIIACLEQIAYNNGWITIEQLQARGELLKKNSYGAYLNEIVNQEKKKVVK